MLLLGATLSTTIFHEYGPWTLTVMHIQIYGYCFNDMAFLNIQK